ncbi:hypothetical protein [Namhaeicola litoreus]|uniref:Gliding motility-associated lipoprotein GldD n=1 Tax=Namhaeicola litoreus TaxID=1052145 RepID=A0ABW3Y4C2_9FLAO
MNRFFTLLLLTLFLSIISCKKSEIGNQMGCVSHKSFSDTKVYKDALKKFKLELPKDWKTQLYVDEYKSEIYTADTTIELTSSFILDVAWHQGSVEFNEEFVKKFVDIQLKNELLLLEQGEMTVKGFPAFYDHSKGHQNGFDFNFIQIYIKTKPDEYYTLSSKVYGIENIDERLCTSLAILDDLEFIE